MDFATGVNMVNCFFEIVLGCILIVHMSLMYLGKRRPRVDYEVASFVNHDTSQMHNTLILVDKLDDVASYMNITELQRNEYIEESISKILHLLSKRNAVVNVKLDKALCEFYHSDITKGSKATLNEKLAEIEHIV